MVMEAIKSAFSKEHMMAAVAVLVGYVVAKIVTTLLGSYIAPMMGTEESTQKWGYIIAAVVSVIVVALIPWQRGMLVAGALVVLFMMVLKVVGVDINSWIAGITGAAGTVAGVHLA